MVGQTARGELQAPLPKLAGAMTQLRTLLRELLEVGEEEATAAAPAKGGLMALLKGGK